MAPCRSKTKQFAHISDVLATVLKDCRRETNDVLNRLGGDWGAIAGPMLAEHSRPVAMKGRMLLVQVSSSVWLQEMRYLKGDLLAAVHRVLGKPLVSDITFKVR